ncbi:hypothetical protein ACHJH3_00840 [Campylobacter sp. MOP7]|uniref:hypothetical protein n=1 Tax=Campylobacter canis TaxID=3378588 RepID=UPI00387EC99E
MKINGMYVCNVCGITSEENSNAVFIHAHKNGQEVEICTSCIPSVVHGSGVVVKSNEELLDDMD